MDEDTVDVSKWTQHGHYYIAPPEFTNLTNEQWKNLDKDFRAFNQPYQVVVWSIGRVEVPTVLNWRGGTVAVPPGAVVASLVGDMYERQGVHCLWLR